MSNFGTGAPSKVVGAALVVMVLLGRYADGPAADFLAGTATGILIVAGIALVYAVAKERRPSRPGP